MTSTVFTDNSTVVVAAWLNDANTAVYTTVPAIGTKTANLPTVSAFAGTMMDDVDAASVRATIGAAAVGSFATSGANSDITSLAGLTTALSIAQGGTGGLNANTARANLLQLPPVRQTVLNGPVDSNGFAAFVGATGSTTVTATGTLTPTAANGVAGDYIGSSTNPSWTGLSTNGTMYLFLDIAASGTCTTGSTTLQPNYQWGGTRSTVSGQATFNIQEMSMTVGNGSTAVQTYRVFVGEVTVGAGVVSAITWYALNGRYQSADTAFTYSSSVVLNHNIGNSNVEIIGELVCVTADGGYTTGQVIQLPPPSFETNARGTSWAQSSHKTVTFYIPFSILSVNTSFSYFGVITANWKLRITAKRKAW